MEEEPKPGRLLCMDDDEDLRPRTPLPPRVATIQKDTYLNLTKDNRYQKVPDKMEIKKVLLDLIEKRPELWKQKEPEDKNKEIWVEVGIELYERTEFLYTPTAIRRAFGSAKQTLKTRLKQIEISRDKESEKRKSLWDWDLYRHFRWYYWEMNLGINMNEEIDELDKDALFDGFKYPNSDQKAKQDASEPTSEADVIPDEKVVLDEEVLHDGNVMNQDDVIYSNQNDCDVEVEIPYQMEDYEEELISEEAVPIVGAYEETGGSIDGSVGSVQEDVEPRNVSTRSPPQSSPIRNLKRAATTTDNNMAVIEPSEKTHDEIVAEVDLQIGRLVEQFPHQIPQMRALFIAMFDRYQYTNHTNAVKFFEDWAKDEEIRERCKRRRDN